MTDIHVDLLELQYGPLRLFRDWPSPDVPPVAAGVYTVWQDSIFVYAGMAGRGQDAAPLAACRETTTKSKGLYSRLNSHASGRRSGDQFCVYVADRLLLKDMTPEQTALVASGDLSLDLLVRNYIRDNLGYRFVLAADGREALRVEASVRKGALPAGKPLLNPL